MRVRSRSTGVAETLLLTCRGPKAIDPGFDELKGEWEQAIEQATKAAELNPELEDLPHLLERVQQRLREAGLL